MTVKELIEFLLTSRQNLTAVLKRLERSRFIERVRIIDDGRIRRIRLSKQGAKTWNRMLINIRAYYRCALDGFSNEECLMLSRLLDRLKSRLASL
jgi:DNA-binding MarR family transcriptional regulator